MVHASAERYCTNTETCQVPLVTEEHSGSEWLILTEEGSPMAEFPIQRSNGLPNFSALSFRKSAAMWDLAKCVNEVDKHDVLR